MMPSYTDTHLCGTYRGQEPCAYLFRTYEAGELRTTPGGRARKLEPYCFYCWSEGKFRKIGSAAAWTGNSPKWCPKRMAKEFVGE